MESVSNNQTHHYDLEKQMDAWFTVLCSITVLFLRGGFVMLHLSCIPTDNTMRILIHNLLDMTLTSFVFIVIGFALSFGKDAGHVIGTTNFFFTDEYRTEIALVTWSIVITVPAIVMSVTVARIRTLGLIIQTLVLAGFVLPLILHWAKSENGWMRVSNLMDHKVEFQDHGGAAFIHLTGGGIALVSSVSFGRKIMVLGEMDEKSLPPAAPVLAILGYFFVILGFVGIGCASYIYVTKGSELAFISTISVLLNTLTAISSGVLVTAGITFLFQRQLIGYWTALKCIQGGLAGLVTISGGFESYTPLASFGISILGSLVFCLWVPIGARIFVEDYLNVIGVHFLCGLIGTIVPPLANKEYGFFSGGSHQALLNLGWNCICLIVILCFSMSLMAILIISFYFCGILRCAEDVECHLRAQIIASQKPGKERLHRLFQPEEGRTLYLRPGYCLKTEACVESMLIERPDSSFHPVSES